MAAPNIVQATSIIGKTTYLSLSDTSVTTVVSNEASSNKVLKINTLIIANDDGTDTADVTIKVHDAASGGGNSYRIASTVAVTSDSTLVLLDKTSGIYLEENTSITAQASAGDDLDIILSYEEIS